MKRVGGSTRKDMEERSVQNDTIAWAESAREKLNQSGKIAVRDADSTERMRSKGSSDTVNKNE